MNNKLLPESKLLAVALDHIPLGIMSGWENVQQTLELVVEGEPDLTIVNFGILKHFASLLCKGTKPVLRLDGSPSYLVEDWRNAKEWDLLYTVDDAVRLGAYAVIVNVVVGGVTEMPSVRIASRVASACLERNIPIIVSAYIGSDVQEHDEKELAAFSARLSAELGADIINLNFEGNLESIRYITSVCPSPVLLAGGAFKTNEYTLRRAAVAIDGGCEGICFGRSIWQSGDPPRVMRALHSVIKNTSNLEEAIGSIATNPVKNTKSPICS